MYKIFVLVLMFSFATSMAQDELVEKDFPKIGLDGNYRSSTPQVLKSFDELGGKDVVWDYSTITNTQELEQIYWKPFADASEGAKEIFKNATYFQTPSAITTVTNYFLVTKEGYKQLGYKLGQDFIKFEKPIDYFPIPMKFGLSYESEFTYDYNGKAEGKYTVIFDGYGKLMLPDNTTENVYRLKQNFKTVFEEEPNDTIKTTGYQFLQRATGRLLFSVVEIGKTENQDQKLYIYQYFVSPIITGVNEELSNNTKIYPNPATDFINIDTPEIFIDKLDIVDINGKVINSANYTKSINISKLLPGTYFIKAETISNELIIKKFVKD
ncbi:MAG: T9SS type A sorting domain-containing protein [Candidatus Kapaibacterium sp.]|nr:T9SS type A sorting domain-containing protein [Ignavibacteriota bacterium]MCB9221190.1 T9SS type A sorting domain-containing protein [Ignavibacteria bacterium]